MIEKLQQDHWSESGERMLFHAFGSFAVVEQLKRRLPPLRSVLSPLAVITRMKSSTPHIVAVALFAAGSLLIGGCGFAQGKKDAEAVLTRHFRTIATNGFDAAMSDYGTQFFTKTTKDEWTKALTTLSGKLGTYQSHTVIGWRTFKKAGTSGAGTTVSLQCQVTYSKHTATESFTLFKGVGDSDYKITGHNINSTALLTE